MPIEFPRVLFITGIFFITSCYNIQDHLVILLFLAYLPCVSTERLIPLKTNVCLTRVFISYGIAKHHCTLKCHMINSKAKNLTSKSLIFTLSTIHALFTFGALLFTIIVFIIADKVVLEFAKDKSIFVYIVPIVSMISYFGSNFFFNKQLANIVQSKSLKDKLGPYLQACVVRFTFLEGAAILSTIAYSLNNHIFYLVISLFLILYLFKLRPTKKKVMSDLKLTLADQQFFQKEHWKSN